MIDEIIADAEDRMNKSLHSLESAFNKIRTGRAHPGILDSVMVPYYGTDTPIQQVANITVEDARTIAVTPWEKNLLPEVEKAILKSDLGLNPSNNGDVIRIPMPALTEETRKEFTRQAKHEAENARIAIRNIRRDANNDTKELLKDKVISEDEERRAEQAIQKLTDSFIGKIEAKYEEKEADLLTI